MGRACESGPRRAFWVGRVGGRGAAQERWHWKGSHPRQRRPPCHNDPQQRQNARLTIRSGRSLPFFAQGCRGTHIQQQQRCPKLNPELSAHYGVDAPPLQPWMAKVTAVATSQVISFFLGNRRGETKRAFSQK
jgi:hypothetical protein